MYGALLTGVVSIGLALMGQLPGCTQQPDGTWDQNEVWAVDETHVFTPEEAAQVNSGDQLDLFMDLSIPGDWQVRCTSELGGTPEVIPPTDGSTDPESGEGTPVCRKVSF